MSVVERGEGRIRARGGHGVGVGRRTRLTFLGIDNLVEHLAATLTEAGARTVETVVQDRTVRLVVNEEEMAKVFTTLVARGAAVRILGGVVPVEGEGCAFLSVSVRAEQPAESEPLDDALKALWEIIRKHGGSFRLGRQPGGMRISLYLPALRGA